MRIINLIGEIDNITIKETLEKIFEIEKEDKIIIEENKKLLDKNDHKPLEDLIVNITSVGGVVYGFNAIYDALTNLKCKVITRGFGICGSCAFYLLLAGDERLAGRGTDFLYHTLSYSPYNPNLYSHMVEIEHQKKSQERLNKIVLDKTNITKEMLESKKNEDWWITFDEAIELGVIDNAI